ncbi:MAG: Proteasome subunit beta type-6 [Phylliscum demangeonii]|nr:MAG: Proteasome subunit beta type-6 [Phylliscum demangeonii]
MSSMLDHGRLMGEEPGFSFSTAAALSHQASAPRAHGFYPYAPPTAVSRQRKQLTDHEPGRYSDNGGSTLGITGSDYAILAGDTRSTAGYTINTRYAPKVFRIGGSDSNPDPDSGPDADADADNGAHLVLAVVGFAADGHALKERLDHVVKMYRYQHGKRISVKACAQRLSTILYNKRFFPYYVQAILAGLDEDGAGALYSYDPVGSYEREQCRAAGAAASLIMPFLDNQVNFKNQYQPLAEAEQGGGKEGGGLALRPRDVVPLPRADVEDLVRDAFTSAVERHIEVGDGLQMMVVTKDGIRETYAPLKRD